jgi:hypothetical protein
MASYLVAGAGYTNVNGEYNNTGVLVNGRESYIYTGASISGGTQGFTIHWYTGAGGPCWALKSNDDTEPDSHVYRNFTDSITPPESGWVSVVPPDGYGANPAPLVSLIGPTATFIRNTEGLIGVPSTNTPATTGTAAIESSGNDRLLLVKVHLRNIDYPGRIVSGITYGGVALTLHDTHEYSTADTARIEFWYLIAPPVGTYDVEVTISGGSGIGVFSSELYNNVDAVPLSATQKAVGTAGSSPTINVPATTNDIVTDAAHTMGTSTTGPGVGANGVTGMTQTYGPTGLYTQKVGGGRKLGSTSVAMSYGGTSYTDSIHMGCAVKGGTQIKHVNSIAISNSGSNLSLDTAFDAGTENNRIMLVWVRHQLGAIESPSYNGQVLSQLGSPLFIGTGFYLSLFYRKAPASGSNTLHIQGTVNNWFAVASVYSGVDQDTTFRSSSLTSDVGTTNPQIANILATRGDMVVAGGLAGNSSSAGITFHSSINNVINTTYSNFGIGTGSKISQIDTTSYISASSLTSPTYVGVAGTSLLAYSTVATTGGGGSAPDPPTGLAVAITTDNPLELTVSWNDDGTGTGYTLERSIDGGTNWSTVVNRLDVISYLDTDVELNTTYHYRVSSYDTTYGDEGTPSSSVNITTPNVPNAPNLTDLVEGSGVNAGKMELIFNFGTDPVPDGVKVFRKRSDDVDYTELTGLGTSTSSPRYDDTIVDGYIYSYKLIAYNEYGDSGFSNVLSLSSKVIITADDLVPETPHERRISWNAVADAANYSIYRGLEGTGVYELVVTTTDLTYDDYPLDDGVYMGNTALDYYVVANVMRSILVNGIKTYILDVLSAPSAPPKPYLSRPDLGIINVRMIGGTTLVDGASQYNLWWRDISLIPTPAWTEDTTVVTTPADVITLPFIPEGHKIQVKWVATPSAPENAALEIHGLVRDYTNNLQVDGTLPKPKSIGSDRLEPEDLTRDGLIINTPIWVPDSELWEQTPEDDRVPLDVTGIKLQFSYSGSEWRYADLYDEVPPNPPVENNMDTMPLPADTDHRHTYFISGYPDLFNSTVETPWVKGRYYYVRWVYVTGTVGVDEEVTASYFNLFQLEPAPPAASFIEIVNDNEAVFLVPLKLPGINSLSLSVAEDGTDNWFTQVAMHNLWNKKDINGNYVYEPGVSTFKVINLKKNTTYKYRWVVQWQHATYFSDGSHNADDLNVAHGTFTTGGVLPPDAPNGFLFDDTWAKSIKVKAPAVLPTTGPNAATNIRLWYKKDGDVDYKLAAQNIVVDQTIIVRGQDVANGIPRNALVPDSVYWFYMDAVNAAGTTSTAVVGEKTDLTDPPILPTFNFTIRNITAETINVNWPALTDEAIVKIRLYYKDLDTDSGWFAHPNEYSGQNVIIDGLTADTRYSVKLAKVFPGDIEEESSEIIFNTLVHTPPVPVVSSRSGSILNIASQVFKSDWKRLDLEKKDGVDWDVIETQSLAGAINNLTYLPESEFRRVALGDYSQAEGESLIISSTERSPEKVGGVALSSITDSGMTATVPTLPDDADYINIFYTNDLTGSWTQLGGNHAGGENLPVTGLLANEFYYFKAEAHNTTGFVTGEISYAATLKTGDPTNPETGIVPMVSYVLLDDGTVRVTAPSVDQWPSNTRYLILEAREKTENNLSPETNLWRVAKNNVHIGDEFILDRVYTVRGLTSEFRWVAKNDGV